MIKTRIAHGSLVPEHRAVYAVTRMPVERGRETAALLAVGPPVALGDEFAGALWGFWEDPPVDLPITVIVPGCRARSRPGIRVRRSRSLTAADVTVHEGLPVTTPARIIFDLAAAGHPPRRVERAFDEAWARHLISRTKMTEQLERHRGRPGTPLLAQLLAPDRGRGVTREAAEERLLQLIRQAHLPDPDRNVQLGPYTVDFLWPEAGVAVEFDSFTWHSSASAFRRDREKDAYMKDVGLDLQRVTWSMLEDPVALIARLVRAVALGTRRAAAA